MYSYAVFAGDDFYPQGGWHDFVASFPDLDNAEDALVEQTAAKHRWCQIVDLESGEILRDHHS